MRKSRKQTGHSNVEVEQHCLNCGVELKGSYCYQCGQKAFFHKDHFFHLMYEFVADYFHFDGKFFSTLKILFTHPGLLTREYISGKRKKYLNPIQMYIFVSACFFFLFTGVLKKDEERNESRLRYTPSFYDSISQEQIRTTRTAVYTSEVGFMLTDLGFCVNNKAYTIHDYDSLERLLPVEKREKGFYRNMHINLLAINERTPDPTVITSEWLPEAFLHHLPKAFFLLLPVFAFLLWLCFSKFYYVEHIIFSIHFHVVLFIMFSLYLTLTVWFPVLSNIQVLYGLLAGILLYLFLSLKKVFQKNILPTFIRWILVSTIYTLLFSLVMVALIIFSVFTL